MLGAEEEEDKKPTSFRLVVTTKKIKKEKAKKKPIVKLKIAVHKAPIHNLSLSTIIIVTDADIPAPNTKMKNKNHKSE